MFDRQRAESVSVLALELAKAAQAAGPGVFERYHYRVFEAMHDDGRKLKASDLLTIARDAGLDTGRFEVERREGMWLHRVAKDHREGMERWKVFGTPTLVLHGEAAVYLKFTQASATPSAAAEVYDARVPRQVPPRSWSRSSIRGGLHDEEAVCGHRGGRGRDECGVRGAAGGPDLEIVAYDRGGLPPTASVACRTSSAGWSRTGSA